MLDSPHSPAVTYLERERDIAAKIRGLERMANNRLLLEEDVAAVRVETQGLLDELLDAQVLGQDDPVYDRLERLLVKVNLPALSLLQSLARQQA